MIDETDNSILHSNSYDSANNSVALSMHATLAYLHHTVHADSRHWIRAIESITHFLHRWFRPHNPTQSLNESNRVASTQLPIEFQLSFFWASRNIEINTINKSRHSLSYQKAECDQSSSTCCALNICIEKYSHGTRQPQLRKFASFQREMLE